MAVIDPTILLHKSCGANSYKPLNLRLKKINYNGIFITAVEIQ